MGTYPLLITIWLLGIVSAYIDFHVFENVPEPEGWVIAGRPYPQTQLQLRIAMRMPDHNLFENMLYKISFPDHIDYGKHLNREEVRTLVSPTASSTEAVLSWLVGYGVDETDIEDSGQWIKFKVSVAKAEIMLGTKFHFYRDKSNETGAKIIRTLRYSLPSNVIPHISMIHPTTRFSQPHAMHSNIFRIESPTDVPENPNSSEPVSFLDPTCNQTITPACLRALYNIGDYQADSNAGSLFGVAGYLKEYAKYGALDSFLHDFAPYALEQNFTYSLINGGLATQNDTVDDDGEANLDIQYAASLGFEQDIVYYSTGGLGPLVPDLDEPSVSQNEPYLDFLDYVLALDDSDLPQTITTSYGENEQSVPEAFARTVCDKFGQLGLRTVSVLFSSGDEGPGSSCQTNDGENTTRFNPIFPAACPYVTSVGGTRHIDPEEAVFFSSGGFSDRFPRPSYQDQAVNDYLEILGDRWRGLYNSTGRGFPDVAAQGYRFVVKELNDTSQTYEIAYASGTSASSPTFAAVISLINNARLSKGKKPLGFLNPWLYSVGKEGLNDIVHGGSTGCTGESAYSGLKTSFVPYAGWNATIGWDPATGLGTPNLQKLLELSSPGFEMGHIEE